MRKNLLGEKRIEKVAEWPHAHSNGEWQHRWCASQPMRQCRQNNKALFRLCKMGKLVGKRGVGLALQGTNNDAQSRGQLPSHSKNTFTLMVEMLALYVVWRPEKNTYLDHVWQSPCAVTMETIPRLAVTVDAELAVHVGC